MDASTRLYKRLGEIPEDPNDPESLADLLVCAFGAFERYYVCWKTQGGEYRQDGYDLPPALRDWLYPTDGTTRDFPSLQVVFGRGEEYFASDKNGKLEYKEPEVKKQVEEEDKMETKPALKRSRTVSFFRPLSDVSTRSDVVAAEAVDSRRSSSTSSRRLSRTPSLSYSRSSSDAASLTQRPDQMATTQPWRPSQSSAVAQWAEGAELLSSESMSPTKHTIESVDLRHESNFGARPAPLPLRAVPTPPKEFQVPEGYMLVPIGSQAANGSCTCNCHDTSIPRKPASTYRGAGVQTSPLASPPRTALRIDTTAAPQYNPISCSAVSHEEASPMYEDVYAENPIYMGRMMTSYFSKPGYQLGDSLIGGYQVSQPMVYVYQEEFGEEALR